MAPDRGASSSSSPRTSSDNDGEDARLLQTDGPVGQEPSADFLQKRSEQPQFTLRALLLGLLIGVLIAFSNTYFGLQTGWISGMAMPSALIGFAYFRGLRTLMCKFGSVGEKLGWGAEFSEVENVLVQTVAGSVGTMPLGCGFVGVVPALEFLLKKEETPSSTSTDSGIVSALAAAEETGGLRLPLGKLVLWALGLCFFGVMFAVPLRKEVIVREKLKFPSGTATALVIGVLHGGEKTGAEGSIEDYQRKQNKSRDVEEDGEDRQRLMDGHDGTEDEGSGEIKDKRDDWKAQIRLLTNSFCISGAYVCINVQVLLEKVTDLQPTDSSLILRSNLALNTYLRYTYVQGLALEPEPFAGLCWSRYHHGPCYHDSHVPRCLHRVGHPVTNS